MGFHSGRLIALALAANCCVALPVFAAGPMSDAGILRMIKDRIDVQQQSVAIVVGIADQKGRRIISSGPADRRSGRAADGDTVFEIGSVTKLFTSLLLADMVEKGEVRLTDPVQMYMPASVVVPTYNGQQITLLDLALHRSGLPRDPTNLKPVANILTPVQTSYTAAQLYAFLSGYRMEMPIGTEFYSNLGFGLLGHALALHADTDFDHLVRQRITGPLGMTSTSVIADRAMLTRRATGYRHGVVAPNFGSSVLDADGALQSTANDMLAFLSASTQLTPSPIDAAMSRMKQPFPARPEVHLGWHIINWRGSEIWWHNGMTYGYASFAAFDKRNGMAVIVLSNSNVSVDDIGVRVLNSSFPLAPFEPPEFKRNLETNDYRQVIPAYLAFHHRDPQFHLDEERVNDWGYGLIEERKFRQAIELLKLNVYLHPGSANTYDSLALAYEKHGDIALAIANYRKALEIEPNNRMLDAHDRLKVLAPLPDNLSITKRDTAGK
jgi:CubicO group peptidase (beta-lactamase class C family)